jgi:2-phosphoglycerate kinase
MAAPAAPPWTVLLIGGASGTGKTLAAELVARRFGVPWLQVDDFRLALQRATSPEQLSDVHYFVNAGADASLWERPEDELVDALRSVARAMSTALEIVVANHVSQHQPVVLEGDGIDPRLASASRFAGVEAGKSVRSIFLVEPDEAALLAAMEARGPRGGAVETTTLGRQARVAWLYGRWIEQEARRLGLPVVAARPHERLVARIAKDLR